MTPTLDHLTVATDGACSGNPGPTGWAWAAQDGTWAAGGVTAATNQVGEGPWTVSPQRWS